ncbi:hypothetical protein N9917_05070, partial [Deltaproteobacteria bacterium]|nr:hypothetical protein [Deltaproteobacteria bacterium]
MSVQWMWGWELGTSILTYQQTGWGFPRTSTNLSLADTGPFQPASGYGGGRYNYRGGNQRFSAAGAIQTPSTGKNSIGVRSRFIFHTAYKRVGVTGSDDNNRFVAFLSGTSVLVELCHTITLTSSAPMELRVNGVVVATTTTVYTSTQPYHRIVFDMDGPNGNYNVYINGILEISVGASAQTFPSINVVEFQPGSNGSFGTPGQ